MVGDGNFKTALPNDVSADEFAENVLGFEEVEEMEQEEGEYIQQDPLGASYPGAMQSGYQMHNEVIPEEDI